MLRQTKFDHPSIPQDLVARPRLTDALNQGLSRPLTLICALVGALNLLYDLGLPLLSVECLHVQPKTGKSTAE